MVVVASHIVCHIQLLNVVVLLLHTHLMQRRGTERFVIAGVQVLDGLQLIRGLLIFP
jgi:hypothetical protein